MSRTRGRLFRRFASFFGLAVLSIGPPAALAADVELGEKLYLKGVTASGDPLTATTVGDVTFSGVQASCAGCHRASGYGSSEGGVYVLPTTGPTLFSERELDRADLFKKLFKEVQPSRFGASVRSSHMRPAYTDETLARAIREGLDPSGRELDRLMPRYQIGDQDMANLIAHLKGLSIASDPGVDATHIHFATVVSEGVDPERRTAMLATLATFTEWMNIDTRGDLRNPNFSPNYRSDFIKAYRLWTHHVWELSGDPDTWPEQLAEHYEQQPVFALLSGMTDGPWTPVAEFCEERRIPALFPHTDLPETGAQSVRTVYFNRGLELEADLIDHQIREEAEGRGEVKVFNLHERRPAGTVPGRRLSALLTTHDGYHVIDRDFDGLDELRDVLNDTAANAAASDVVVLWPGALSRGAGTELAEVSIAAERIYIPAAALDGLPGDLAPASAEVLRFSFPYELPTGYHPRAFRIRAWMNTRRLALTHPRLQFNTYYALTMAQFGLEHIVDNFSRDYLLEYVEHEAENALNPGTFPTLSLGPGQRFASKGGFVVKLKDPSDIAAGIAPVSQWIVP